MRRQPLRLVNVLLLAAVRSREERKAWQLWLALYPYMVVPSAYTREGTPLLKFVPFARFWDDLAGRPAALPELTAEEIIARFEPIKEKHQRAK